MLKKKSQVIITILFIADLLIIGLSWNLAYYARFFWLNYSYSVFGFEVPRVATIQVPKFIEYFRVTIVVMFFAAVCFIYSKMYNPKRISRYKAEFSSILRSHIVLFIILIALTFYYRRFSYSRVQSLYFLTLSIVFVTSFRLFIRSFLSYLRSKGKNLRRIAIIGAGKTAVGFINKVLDNRRLGFEIVGYVYPEQPSDFTSASYLGKYEDLPKIIQEETIDQVYICLDSNQQSDLKEINHYLAEQMIDLNIVPDIYNTLNINPEILDLDGMPIIALRQSSVDGWNRIFKRAFDIVGSTVAIVLLLPVWAILPILIKLTSPGPVFYLQERMGLDGKSFQMIKFRSMKVDAEEETGAIWATKDD
ncbi:sugar transferase, partial [bacterium]|nr:sugar transferase [bacterium]